MLKHTTLAAALVLSLAAAGPASADPAHAATPSTTAPSSASPASADDCLKIAFDLAQSAEDKKLSEAKLDNVEAMLTKMETQCDAKQFAEAMASADGIRKLIDTP